MIPTILIRMMMIFLLAQASPGPPDLSPHAMQHLQAAAEAERR